MAESRRKPIMNEVHAPDVQTRGAFQTQANRPYSKKDNVDDIIEACVNSLSKFRNMLCHTESIKILEAATKALEHPRKTNFSAKEKAELLDIISNKSTRNKF